MIVCTDFYVKAAFPKYLSKTVEMIQEMENKAFLRKVDLGSYVESIASQLGKDLPVGSDVRLHRGTGELTLYRENGYSSDIARIYFVECKSVLRQSEANGKFLNVYYRLED